MLPDEDGFSPMLFATANGYSELGEYLMGVYDELNKEERQLPDHY
jgi:hypothetical protein